MYHTARPFCMKDFKKAKKLLNGFCGSTATEGQPATQVFLGSIIGEDFYAATHVDGSDATKGVILYLGPAGSSCRFAFPEYNLTIILHPGDVLIFDAQVLHCAEKMNDELKGRFLISCYLNKYTLQYLNAYIPRFQ